MRVQLDCSARGTRVIFEICWVKELVCGSWIVVLGYTNMFVDDSRYTSVFETYPVSYVDL